MWNGFIRVTLDSERERMKSPDNPDKRTVSRLLIGDKAMRIDEQVQRLRWVRAILTMINEQLGLEEPKTVRHSPLPLTRDEFDASDASSINASFFTTQ